MRNKQRDLRLPVRHKVNELFALRRRAAIVQQQLHKGRRKKERNVKLFVVKTLNPPNHFLKKNAKSVIIT